MPHKIVEVGVASGVVLDTGKVGAPQYVDEHTFATTHNGLITSTNAELIHQIQTALDTAQHNMINHPELIDETGACYLKLEIRLGERDLSAINAVFAALGRPALKVVEPKIVSAEIKSPQRFGDRAEVVATFDNGKVETVVSYFDDELSFHSSEFIGLTRSQASELHTRKDTAYLRS